MGTTQQLQTGSWRTLLSTELNSLASGTLSSLGSVAFTNLVGTSPSSTGEAGYPLMDVEFSFGTPSTTFTVPSALEIYVVPLGSDGSTYSYNATAPTANRIVIPMPATATSGRVVIQNIPAPAGTFKLMAFSNGLGAALASSANTINLRFKTNQMN
jgi:hypothetical protein